MHGTYTLHKRPGLLKQIVRTLRPLPNGGWINKIGLRNPGISRACVRDYRDVISIAAMKPEDWPLLIQQLQLLRARHQLRTPFVECNVSCPNKGVINPAPEDIEELHKAGFTPIIKLPPDTPARTLTIVGKWLECNIKYVHLCNTLKTPQGGVSGPRLKPHSLVLLKTVRRHFGNNLTLIGGGGIYTLKDLHDYQQAGAEHFSVSTACFRPDRLYRLYKELKDPTSIDKSE